MDAAIRGLPKGRVTRTSTHDPVPGTPAEGVTIKVDVAVEPEAGKVVVDLTDNPDCMPCGLNLSEACARSAALLGVFNSIDPSVPKNAGSYRRIEVKLRENCICGIPKHPTSCSVATTNIADRVANPIQAAMAEIEDGLGLAEAGLVMPPSIGVISGTDPRSGEAYVNEVYLGITGGAASPTSDAWLSIVHVGNAGMCYQDSIELDELRQPIFVAERRLLPDTEGAGRTRGAPSAYAAFGPTTARMCVAYVSDGGQNPATGTRGGGAGGRSWQKKRHADDSEEDLPNCAEVWLEPGDLIVSASCGGGGYGDPKARPVEKVLHDVAEGWVTTERARDVYGVAVNPDGTLDVAETVRYRGRSTSTVPTESKSGIGTKSPAT
jgi:N-methylhydantoinase B